MKLSDKIANDKSLIEYARSLDPIYYLDHFNNAWLIFRKKELEEEGFVERVRNNYKAYFVRIVKKHIF